ncbi:MAG: type II toxin-antitoxin system HicB family antitoxin [Pyrinomonadaceae bacterium]
MKSPADVYEKIVVWSNEDSCFIGMCPELFLGGVHGCDALKVFKELCEVVDEWVEIFEKDGKPLPAPKNAALREAA